MKKSKTISLIIYALFFLGGIFLGYGCFSYFHPSGNYYDIRFIEWLQLASVYIVATLIVYGVNTRLHNNVKKRELLVGFIDKFHCKIVDIYSLCSEYVLKPEKETYQKIVLSFTPASNDLYLLLEVKKDERCRDILKINGEITQDFYAFKSLVTDPQYVQKKPIYDETRMILIREKYEKLNLKIFNYKLSIYTE